MFYKTCFVITMTLWWCNLFVMCVKCCNVWYVMLNYCDLGCMQVGLKSFEISVDYWVYMCWSSRIWSFRRLFLYLCSYKLVGSVTKVPHHTLHVCGPLGFIWEYYLGQPKSSNIPPPDPRGTLHPPCTKVLLIYQFFSGDQLRLNIHLEQQDRLIHNCAMD